MARRLLSTIVFTTVMGLSLPVVLAAVLLRGGLLGFVSLILLGVDPAFALVGVACEVFVIPRIPAMRRAMWGERYAR